MVIVMIRFLDFYVIFCSRLFTFILIRGYFPNTMKKLKKVDEFLKILSQKLKKDVKLKFEKENKLIPL